MARSRIIAGKAVIVIEAQNLVDKTLGKIRSNLNKFANVVGNIGEDLFRTGFFGAIASGNAINSFIQFDDAMRNLRVNLDLFGKSAQQVDSAMKPLERTIRSLAQTTPFSPTQVASAATQLAKGGFSPKQIVDSLQAVLDLSRATNTEIAFSAEFLVRSMTTFGVSTEQASEIVSQFVRATRKGTLGIDDLEAAMRYSSSTADTLGVSLQTMLAVFTVLSNRGLVGSIAGTSTNTAFSQLVKKAQQLSAIGEIDLVTGIREDGREALDVIGSLENLFRYAETLKFTDQQTLFQDIFNLRGARSVGGLREELGRVRQLREEIAGAGDEARQAANIQDAGSGGALRRLISTFQELNITLGESTEKAFVGLAATIKGLLQQLNTLAKTNPLLTSLIIFSPAILLAAGAGMLVLSKGLRFAALGVSLLKEGLKPLANILARSLAGKIGLITALTSKKNPIKTLLSFVTVIRRFAFSFSGVFTALELLFVFGDRIPGVATVLERLGKAFTNAFGAIVDIGRLASGPIALFKASIEAFTADNSELGVKGLARSFELLAAIVGNQLVLAWAKFREALGTVWGLLRQIAGGILLVFDSIVLSIGSAISSVVSLVGNQLGVIASLFGSKGELKFDDGASVLGEFIKQLTLFASNIPILFGTVIERMGAVLDIFILQFKQAINLFNPFGSNIDVTNEITERIKQSVLALKELEDKRLANIATANELANNVQLPNLGAYITELQATSQELMNQGFAGAEEIRQELAKITEAVKTQASNFDQDIRGTTQSDPQVKATRVLADALVGSVQSTRRNLLRQGKQVEEKQLDEQKRTNQILEAMAQDQGLRFAP